MKRLLHRAATTTTIAVVRTLLLAYPVRFRRRFQDDVLLSVSRHLQASAVVGTLPLLHACWDAAIDALLGILPEHISERYRRQLRGATTPFRGLREDVRQAVRALGKSPGFTTAAISVLALAIGASAAIFSIVDAVLLRGLPFDGYDRLFTVLEYVPGKGTALVGARGSGGSTTPQTFLDWKARQQSFSELAAINRATYRTRNERDEPAEARALRVSHQFFPLLRARPLLGRAFTESDDVVGTRVVVLAHGFWLRQFGGSSDAIGRTIHLNEESWEVVGVMPPGFSYPVASSRPTEIFTPLALRAADRIRSGGRNFQYEVVGRLKDGVSVAQATDDMNRIASAIDAENPGWNPGGRVQLLTLHESIVGRARSWMLLLLGAIALVMLIACANVANLMLVRATTRGREIGIRTALGATRWRITRGLMVEGVLLSGTAASIGLTIASSVMGVLIAWLPDGLPRAASVGIDWRIVGTVAAAALVTGIIFGLAPAVHTARADLTRTLNDGGRTSTPGAAGTRLRNLLVVAELALAVVLLVGAGLFIGSFVRLIGIQPGFDYRNVLTFHARIRFDGSEELLPALRRGSTYIEQLLEAVRRVPGVEEVGAVSGGLPLSGGWKRSPVKLPSDAEFSTPEEELDTREVTADYLQLLRVPLVRGRYPSPTDRLGSTPVVVVNEAAAARYWAGRTALGESIAIDGKEKIVVGVVGNVRHGGPETPPRPEAYVPMAQDGALGAALVLRTKGDPLALIPAVKAAVWSVNPEHRFTSDTVTMERYMDRLIAARRFNMALLTTFGMLGLVIAAAGTYGVMAYVVAQRTAEIGVRMALGATPQNVLALVLGNSSVLVAFGLIIGSIGAWYLSAGVERFLFETTPTDPRVFAGAIATLTASALAACVVPARRAASVDPLIALRHE